MLIRIVRMTFQADKVAEFLDIFQNSKHKIRAFEGCQHLELLQDAAQPHIFCTYSHWLDESYLENYRQSVLFQTTWSATKKLFAEKPQAYSLRQKEIL